MKLRNALPPTLLTDLLEQTPFIPLRTKLSILNNVALGVGYLHSRTPPANHPSFINVLLSKNMEAKIGDLGTLRLIARPDKAVTNDYSTWHYTFYASRGTSS